jgi:branched-chain amino acid transport system ATP-binding protein
MAMPPEPPAPRAAPPAGWSASAVAPDAGPAAGRALLLVEGLHAYYGQAHILADVTLSAAAGDVLALLGRNGAGKSTTLKSIMGLVRPAAGAISFDDARIDGAAPYRIARLGLGYVPEDRRIFTDLSVMENLEVGRQAPRRDAPTWTPDKLFALFPNLGRMRDRLGSRMSGGEQQMLTIARTLMGNPRCVLLDEPSEGLAPLIVEQMAAAIRTLRQEGLCVILSEQNLHFASLVADRAVVLEKGRVRFAGTMDELRADAGVREQYLSV